MKNKKNRAPLAEKELYFIIFRLATNFAHFLHLIHSFIFFAGATTTTPEENEEKSSFYIYKRIAANIKTLTKYLWE